MKKKRWLRLIAAVTVFALLVCLSPEWLQLKASAAYESTSSSYTNPIRMIANTGRGVLADKSHKAIDLTVPKGTPVYASMSGTVVKIYSGCINNNGASSNGTDCKAKGCTAPTYYMNGSGYKAGYYCNGGVGNGVVVKNTDGKYATYAHMSKVDVKVNDKVTTSTKLGEVGSTGCSTGAHLHFALMSKANSADCYNPFIFGFPGFKLSLLNIGSGSVNPQFRVDFAWKDFSASQCRIELGTSPSSLTKTDVDKNFTCAYNYYNLGTLFGSYIKTGQTYYIRVVISKDGYDHTSPTYSFVVGSGNKVFLDYSKVENNDRTVYFYDNLNDNYLPSPREVYQETGTVTPTKWYVSRDTSVATMRLNPEDDSLIINAYSGGGIGKDIQWRTTINGSYTQSNYELNDTTYRLYFQAKSSVPGTELCFRWGYDDDIYSVELSDMWQNYEVDLPRTQKSCLNLYSYLSQASTVELSFIRLVEADTWGDIGDTDAFSFQTVTGSADNANGIQTPMPRVNKEGYAFDGWYTLRVGGLKVADGGDDYSVKNLRGFQNLYAHWIKTECDHVFEEELILEPECEANGWISHTCTICGYAYDEYLPPIGHAWTEWYEYGEYGHRRHCLNDSEHFEMEEHIWAEKETEDGYLKEVCSVCGAENTVSPELVTVTVTDASAMAGETCDVYLCFNETTAIKSMAVFDLVYDPDLLELTGGEWLSDDALIKNWNTSQGTGVITFGSDTEVTGAFLKLQFKVSEQVSGPDIAFVCCNAKVTIKEDGQPEASIPVTVQPGTVFINEYTVGDLNGDGMVDSDDAIYLLYSTLLPDSYPLNQSGDMNGDGMTDSDDAIYLLYYTLLPDAYPLH